ncbi:MAG: ArsA family ATPase [Myxococcales bacterium]|nr:ArsA family ATPase [Myxococcales bacterium]
MTTSELLERYRLVVCVGTGGVGKTTMAAALALAAAMRGKRALVLTIDPARALARSLGVNELGGASQRVPGDVLAAAGLSPSGVLSAAMLDQKQAWDAFVTRTAPDPTVARTLLANPFYQRLSTSFAGSTEYMAVEEMCRYTESNEYDLIVLDTPPAAHALDFLRAPERIDRLLDRDVSGWFGNPFEAVRKGAWRSAGVTARFVLRRLEHATGKSTLRDISAFFVALETLVDATLERTRRSRALLRGGDAAFVLVTAPKQLVLDETQTLAAQLAAQHAPLAAVIVNRVHPLAADEVVRGDHALAGLGTDPAARWLQRAWAAATMEAQDEVEQLGRFSTTIPTGIPVVRIPEAAHDLHSLRDLAQLVGVLDG